MTDRLTPRGRYAKNIDAVGNPWDGKQKKPPRARLLRKTRKARAQKYRSMHGVPADQKIQGGSLTISQFTELNPVSFHGHERERILAFDTGA